MPYNYFLIDQRQKKPTIPDYSGKFVVRTDVTKTHLSPAFSQELSELNNFFNRRSDVFYIRISRTHRDPYRVYKNLTLMLRKLNKARNNKVKSNGYRICNVHQCLHNDWRFICNIVCTGSYYSSEVFRLILCEVLPSPRNTLYLKFITPRKSQVDKAYKDYYQEFYNRAHVHYSDTKIVMLENYYWSIDTHSHLGFILQILFDIFGPRIDYISSNQFDGIEISQINNIDPEDYHYSDNHLLGSRIRFIQPFGEFYKHIITPNTNPQP